VPRGWGSACVLEGCGKGGGARRGQRSKARASGFQAAAPAGLQQGTLVAFWRRMGPRMLASPVRLVYICARWGSAAGACTRQALRGWKRSDWPAYPTAPRRRTGYSWRLPATATPPRRCPSDVSCCSPTPHYPPFRLPAQTATSPVTSCSRHPSPAHDAPGCLSALVIGLQTNVRGLDRGAPPKEKDK
jgi:hypothetical protein